MPAQGHTSLLPAASQYWAAPTIAVDVEQGVGGAGRVEGPMPTLRAVWLKEKVLQVNSGLLLLQ